MSLRGTRRAKRASQDSPPAAAKAPAPSWSPARARHVRSAVLLLAFIALPAVSAQAPVLRWGGDAEGGAPFVEADPQNPSHVVGFDVEIAELIAKELARRPEFVQITFTELDQSVARGDFDIGLSGIEDTPARRAAVAATIPYYEFQEVLTVRAADRDKFRTLADFRGHRVATLGGTIAYETLLEAERTDGIRAVSYDDDVHPYSDLLLKRVDAVLLDNVLAHRSLRRNGGLAILPGSVKTAHYIIILSPAATALRDKVDEILRGAMRDGRLEAIFRKWNEWNDDQRALYARLTAPSPSLEADGSKPAAAAPAMPSKWEMTRRYVPSLFSAAGMTLVLSCLSMALAVAAGAFIAIGRVYGRSVTRALLTFFVEVIRGTPILLQLFVIYYGLAAVVRLPAFIAALVGLGLNYAAYESEIYRSALEAIPVGQLEAAQVLGLTRRQVLWLVRGPQALRIALAPMTNDFVAMLKDSSLVSVLTVVELTKQTQIFATNLGSWVIPGVLCSGLYLVMSLPLARLARVLEARWKAPTEG
jgi:polar amino acid transport system substrate-binding protein